MLTRRWCCEQNRCVYWFTPLSLSFYPTPHDLQQGIIHRTVHQHPLHQGWAINQLATELKTHGDLPRRQSRWVIPATPAKRGFYSDFRMLACWHPMTHLMWSILLSFRMMAWCPRRWDTTGRNGIYGILARRRAFCLRRTKDVMIGAYNRRHKYQVPVFWTTMMSSFRILDISPLYLYCVDDPSPCWTIYQMFVFSCTLYDMEYRRGSWGTNYKRSGSCSKRRLCRKSRNCEVSLSTFRSGTSSSRHGRSLAFKRSQTNHPCAKTPLYAPWNRHDSRMQYVRSLGGHVWCDVMGLN